MQCNDVLEKLKTLSDPKAVDGMAIYGINPENTYGVSIPNLRKIAKEVGVDHTLAQQLWVSGIHEARILASMIAAPKMATEEQLETRRLELEYLLSDTKVELADMKTVAGYMADLRNLLNESPLAERKSFIKSFVKEVKVIGTEVRLIYTIPMPPKGISQEAVGVSPIVHYGGRYSTIGRTFELTFAFSI